jgi:hypothetical protein
MTRPTDARDIMTTQMVAVKPGTTMPEVGCGDARFRILDLTRERGYDHENKKNV